MYLPRPQKKKASKNLPNMTSVESSSSYRPPSMGVSPHRITRSLKSWQMIRWACPSRSPWMRLLRRLWGAKRFRPGLVKKNGASPFGKFFLPHSPKANEISSAVNLDTKMHSYLFQMIFILNPPMISLKDRKKLIVGLSDIHLCIVCMYILV